ncbi:hypothetical protein [Streptomyces sp. NPDC004528]|uniref:hypothetical protein n=1 Tax=Streptomyces sp. NPDC004528 TaxID=3154550 RepID=UPI0033B81A5B
MSSSAHCDNASLIITLLGICTALDTADTQVAITRTCAAVRTKIDRTGLAERLPLYGCED